MRPTLISFDLRAGFGMFKKPDINEGLQLTFNMLHKPALLGILGAITGLEGYRQRGQFPAYYHTLRNLLVGIEPLGHEKGNFTKTVVKYTNTVGYANADGNLIITEQTLRSPAYRCYLLPDIDDPIQARLHDRILACEAEYLPYLGKNECSAWWDANSTHDFSEEKPEKPYVLATIFRKTNWTVREQKDDGFEAFDLFDLEPRPETFIYFERLPVDFDERLMQYRLDNFAFTNFHLRPSTKLDNLYYLPKEQKYVRLF
ncbi:MAG: type I-B CRISPR-associated protein Cas5 [Lewinellaceae bacterium]|nr:type I-B CRISPR-associated protein Cas5 [Lewinellaceae bacterium]